ncbi:MAG: type II secretion system protein [Armatimonadetes bacterium]|nr:type II secretion system protein [Armatimonadota bacterium]NOG38631.1 type II secretion system protein [Armatimonadota bacterium]GIK31164.1 MAG: hypothetical protein BroJett009_01560 [Armatimonadota bacterium]
MKRQLEGGFSLVEVLLVVAIVALTASLVLPTLVRAKRQGQATVCVSNLRQVYMSLQMYMEESGGEPRYFSPTALSEGPPSLSKLLLICPVDPILGDQSAFFRCKGKVVPLNSSYFWPFDKDNRVWKEISRVDSNPGVLACRVHGELNGRWPSDKAFCGRVPFLYSGRLNRIRMDGSLDVARLSLAPFPGRANRESFRYWRLFTDLRTKWDDHFESDN